MKFVYMCLPTIIKQSSAHADRVISLEMYTVELCRFVYLTLMIYQFDFQGVMGDDDGKPGPVVYSNNLSYSVQIESFIKYHAKECYAIG